MLYTCLCAIAKDEAPEDLREWLWYHLGLGFEHAVLYDNGSRLPVADTLAGEVRAGLVTVLPFPQQQSPQLSAYFHALGQWAQRCRWLAFLDIDEFLVPLAPQPDGAVPDVRELLEPYEPFAGLVAHWLTMSSAGHAARPPGGVLRNYCQALGVENHYKSLIWPAKALRPLSPHHFAFADGAYAVNEDGFPVTEHVSYPTARLWRVNHYFYKSREDFASKIARGLATPLRSGPRRMRDFDEHLRRPTHEDHAALQLAAAGERLAALPTPVAAREVTLLADRPLAAYLEEAQRLTDGPPGAAQKALRQARRYHSLPPAPAAGALPQGAAGLLAEAAMAGLREAWLRAEALRAQGRDGGLRAHAAQLAVLGALGQYYRAQGLAVQAQAVEAFAATG